jgi:hypothetical protein
VVLDYQHPHLSIVRQVGMTSVQHRR